MCVFRSYRTCGILCACMWYIVLAFRIGGRASPCLMTKNMGNMAMTLAGIKTFSNILRNTVENNKKSKDGRTTYCSPGTDGVSHSKFTYKPKRAPKGSRYDRVNCRHGSFDQKDWGKQSCTVGNAIIVDVGFSKSSMSNANLLRGNLADVVLSAEGDAGSTRATQLNMAWQRKTYHFSNINTFATALTLYDVICRETGDIGPMTTIADDIADFADPSGTTQDIVIAGNTVSRSFDLQQAKTFRKTWTIRHVTKVDLLPGQTHVHQTFFKTNYVYDTDAQDDRTVEYVAGFSHGVIAMAKGKLVHLVADEQPTFANSVLDAACEYRTYVRQHLPLQDYFYQQIDVWSGTGGAGNTVQGMETEDHVEETGVS